MAPYMIIKGAADAIRFYKKCFGAKEILRLTDDSGKVQHAEIKIGDSLIMVADEFPEIHSLLAELRCIFFCMLKMQMLCLHKR